MLRSVLFLSIYVYAFKENMGAIFSNDISLFGEYKKQSSRLFNWIGYDKKKTKTKNSDRETAFKG